MQFSKVIRGARGPLEAVGKHVEVVGKHSRHVRATLVNSRAAEVDAQAARLPLAANIARTYVALAHAFDAQDAPNAEAARSDALAMLNRERIKAGLDNTIALNQNQSAAAARQQVHAAQQQIDALRNALAALVGAGPDRGLKIARRCPQPLQMTGLAAVPERLQPRRPRALSCTHVLPATILLRL